MYAKGSCQFLYTVQLHDVNKCIQTEHFTKDIKIRFGLNNKFLALNQNFLI